MDSYASLVKVLDLVEHLVESKKSEILTVQELAGEAYLSESHLLRLFKLTTGQSLMDYVRGRKLAHSLKEVFDSSFNIADIAMDCGFSHEQSYIRAFRKEYNCTPGKARKEKMILPIRKRIAEQDLTMIENGVLYGPEIVVIPSFHFIGKPHEFRPFSEKEHGWKPNQLALRFYLEAVMQFSNAIDPMVYYSVTSNLSGGVEVGIEYMPCMQVKDLSHIPKGYTGRTFPTMQCALFRYVGLHPVWELSMVTANEIYKAKLDFFEKQTRYIEHERIRHFERVDTRIHKGGYCQLELMPPVIDTLQT